MAKIVSLEVSGSFIKTEKFFNRILYSIDPVIILNRYGKQGVELLKSNTPIDSGKTSESWSYSISKTNSGYSINWFNSNRNEGVPIAIILQYGHATKNGSWVQGTDYINPAIKSIFSDMASSLWKEVTNK
jgi:hypothetical protein